MKKIPVPVGARFGTLTVVNDGGSGKWTCVCDCGVQKEMYSGGIRNGNVVSCGCLKAARASSLFTTHGMTGDGAHRTWKSMHQRVKSDPDYVEVEICERWNSFENFFADMGERPEGLSLDRRDGTLGYFSENCRWATAKMQSVNRHNVVQIRFNGKEMCVADWAREIGISRRGIMKRINAGWSLERAPSSDKYGENK